MGIKKDDSDRISKSSFKPSEIILPNPRQIKILINCFLFRVHFLGYSSRYRLLYYGNLFLSWLLSFLHGQKITDVETCYKMIKREALDGITIESNRFNFESEITAKLLRRGHKILELPISYRSRSFAQGKKIKWHDGVQAIINIIRYRFFN